MGEPIKVSIDQLNDLVLNDRTHSLETLERESLPIPETPQHQRDFCRERDVERKFPRYRAVAYIMSAMHAVRHIIYPGGREGDKPINARLQFFQIHGFASASLPI
jgi:hypothetical protein